MLYFKYIHSYQDFYRVRIPGLPSKSFNANKFGSSESALKSALQYRDKIFKKVVKNDFSKT